MRWMLHLAALIVLPGFAMAHPPPGADAVGMVVRHWRDDARQDWQRSGPRPLTTTIWYPAVAGTGEERTLGGPMFVAGPQAIGAEPQPGGARLPLVLLSHGTGGTALQLGWLARSLVARGHIVAAVNHHGNTAAEPEPRPEGFLLFGERARDLSAVLDRLLADPQFGPRIDPARIGAAGFSLGGYTVIALAGGRFEWATFDAYCASPARDATCDPQPEFPEAVARFGRMLADDPWLRELYDRAGDSFRDARIGAVFAIAPALGGGFGADGLASIRIPLHVVVGDADEQAPAAGNAAHYAGNIAGAGLTVLPGVGHYTFLAECTAQGRQVLSICKDGDGVDRGRVHRRAGDEAAAFFARAWCLRDE